MTIDVTLRSRGLPSRALSQREVENRTLHLRSFLDGYLSGLENSAQIAITEQQPETGRWKFEILNQNLNYTFMSPNQIARDLEKRVNNYLTKSNREEEIKLYDILVR